MVCVALIVCVTLLLSPRPSAAQFRGSGGSLLQGPIQLGPRAGRDFENRAWSLGAQLQLPLRRNFELRPSADLFFPRGGETGWQANGDAAIRLGQGGGLYAGGGIAFAGLDGGEIETGYNLFFGLGTAPPDQRLKPFLEFRWTFVNDTSPFRLALGFSYALTGNWR
jgi:hypothetical protein